MPTSDRNQRRAYACTLKRAAGILGIALTTGVGLLWLNQQAIERYWQQTRHAPSPFSDISLAGWQVGAQLEDTLRSHLQRAEQWLAPAQDIAADTPLVDSTETDSDDGTSDLPDATPTAPTTEPNGLAMDDIGGQPARDGTPLDMSVPHAGSTLAPQTTPTTPVTAPAEPVAQPAPPPPTPALRDEHTHSILLTPKDRVLFIGDSMMQGVAPHVMKTLLKQYHVQSTNLSLQSTGLAYPGAFDWPGTLRSTLASATDIKVLVVFLGPNDPWDMPSRARGPYLKFKSPAWETEYRLRIRSIIEQAKARDIAVIWIGPPAMKRVALSEGVRFLDTLYQSEVEAAGESYIAVDDLFGYQDHRYSEPVMLNGRQVKLRSDDGTHFTVTGQKLIARAVLSLLQPAPEPVPVEAPAAPAETTPSALPAQTSTSSAARQVFADPAVTAPRRDRSADAAQVFAPRP